jgi:hypothetical protein
MVMMPHRRNGPAAQRYAERRQREDEAPKLNAQVPALARLRLEIEECVGQGSTKYIRTFVVDHAPALFLVPCGDPRCLDGGHDLTREVMRALRAHEVSFRGSDNCEGAVGTSSCQRVVHFQGTAEYHPGTAPAPGALREGTSHFR